MPILAALLVNMFTGLSTFLASFMAARAAIYLAAIAASVTLLATLTVAITAALSGLIAALPDHPMVSTGFYFGIPPNGPAVMSFCLMVDASIAVYRLAMDKVRMGVAA